MFLRKGFNGKFIICAMFASLLSVHVAYAADPVEAIDDGNGGATEATQENCKPANIPNSLEVAWEDDTCVIKKCEDGYIIHDGECVKGCSNEQLESLGAVSGYMQDDKCILTVCADGYDLDAGENKCKVRQSGGGSGTPVNEDCGKNLFNPQLLSEGGFTYNSGTYTFTGKFDRRFDATTHANTGDFVSNYYMTNYSYGLQPNTAYKLVYTINCATDSNSVTSQSMIMGLLTKANGSNTVIKSAPTVGSCSNGSVTVTVSGGSSTTSVVGVYVGRASGVSNDYSGNLTISNVMLVLNSESTSTMIPYGPCIKISTKMATATRATGVEERLSNVRSIISDLITRTQDNADGINGLQSSKQTRPVDANACPSNKTCLLVKDTAGHNNWYEIMTCNSGNFFNAGAIDNAVYDVPGEPFGFREGNDVHLICSDSDAGCADGEWVSSYENGLVYGEAQSLSISNPVGSIVTLPTTGLLAGNVCVCRATDYRVLDIDTNTYGSRVHVNTNKWVVAGVPGDNMSCVEMCSRFDVDQGPSSMLKRDYYAYLNNSCMTGASQANMCLYSEFLGDIADGTIRYQAAENYGWVMEDGTKVGLCETLNDCGGAGSHAWVEKYGNDGYVYGRAKLANIQENDYRDMASHGLIKLTGNETESTVCLCQVTGYKESASATKQSYNNDVWMVVSGYEHGDFETNYDDTTGFACTRSCARHFGTIAEDPGGYFSTIDDLCTGNTNSVPVATPVAQ